MKNDGVHKVAVYSLQEGMMFEGRFSEGLSLVDAVMPDVVLAKQQQLRDKIAAEKLKAEQESQSNQTEKTQNNDEEMTTNGDSAASSSVDNNALTMTTTVVTAATSTTSIKQEPQANGDLLNGIELVFVTKM